MSDKSQQIVGDLRLIGYNNRPQINAYNVDKKLEKPKRCSF